MQHLFEKTILTIGLINYSRNINGFNYVDTWEDSDIEAFVVSELEKMKL